MNLKDFVVDDIINVTSYLDRNNDLIYILNFINKQVKSCISESTILELKLLNGDYYNENILKVNIYLTSIEDIEKVEVIKSKLFNIFNSESIDKIYISPEFEEKIKV